MKLQSLLQFVLVLVTTAIIAPIVAWGQLVLTPDDEFGINGVVQENLPESWQKEYITKYHVLDDGSVYIFRSRSESDTTGLLSKSLRNGQVDPFFNSGSVCVIPKLYGQSYNFYVNKGNPWISIGRASRLEFNKFGEYGELRYQPVWQDDEKGLSINQIGFNQNGDFVMWSEAYDGDTLQLKLRVLTKLGTPQVKVIETLPTSTQFDFTTGPTMIDRDGNLISIYTNLEGKLPIARYFPSGELDESWGNALGIMLINLDGIQNSSSPRIFQTRDGGYLLTLCMYKEPTGTIREKTLLVIKLLPRGGYDLNFGERGVVELNWDGGMAPSGSVELPNGDFIVLSTGVAGQYSHLYHIGRTGIIFPRQYGQFSITPLLTTGQFPIFKGKYLYGIVRNEQDGFSVARYKLSENVLSVEHADNTSKKLNVTNSDGQIFISGCSEPGDITLFTLIGEQVASMPLEPNFEGPVRFPFSSSNSPTIVRVRSGTRVESAVMMLESK